MDTSKAIGVGLEESGDLIRKKGMMIISGYKIIFNF